MKNSNFIENYWQEKPLIIKEFISKQEKYLLLCQEISYILKKELKKENIEYSAVSYRAKTLNSFIEKIQRKKYTNPFNEITDYSGVRVVFLYVKDYDKLEKLIKDNFSIIEKVDKLNEKKVDQFGYGAIHFIVKLGNKYKGARYDDIKSLVCEIQVRTILQDAWAVIDHHLVYKREEDVPTHLRRKLNSLAGLFETADDQFQRIKEERLSYLEEISIISKTPDNFLEIDINIDSFIAFLNWKYPSDMELFSFDSQVEMIFKDIDKRRYKKLRDLNNVFIYSDEKINEIKEEIDKIVQDTKWTKALEIGLRLVIFDNEIRKKIGVPKEWIIVINKKKLEGYSKRLKA